MAPPSASMEKTPWLAPLNVPLESHSREASCNGPCCFSHTMKCEAQATPTKTLFSEPRSSYISLFEGVSSSNSPTVTSVGILIFRLASVFQPQLVRVGARKTPGPQVIPNGSAALLSSQIRSCMPGSNCLSHFTNGFQRFFSATSRLCMAMGNPGLGSIAGGLLDSLRE